MGKKSKQIGGENRKLIVDSKIDLGSKATSEKFQAKIAELSDEQLEKLFESGKINQSEYELILEYRKKLKKKKTDKEKFEERIRCNNGIIQKIVNLGRKFRKQENEYKKYQESLKNNQLEDLDLQKEERIRSKGNGERQIERSHGSKGRTHDR